MSEPVAVTFHARWEANIVLQLLNLVGNGRMPGYNYAEANHIANHVARALDPDNWQNLVNNPNA